MSDKTIQELLDNVRGEIPSLFRVCESIAMLDMIASFGQLVVRLFSNFLSLNFGLMLSRFSYTCSSNFRCRRLATETIADPRLPTVLRSNLVGIQFGRR